MQLLRGLNCDGSDRKSLLILFDKRNVSVWVLNHHDPSEEPFLPSCGENLGNASDDDQLCRQCAPWRWFTTAFLHGDAIGS